MADVEHEAQLHENGNGNSQQQHKKVARFDVTTPEEACPANGGGGGGNRDGGPSAAAGGAEFVPPSQAPPPPPSGSESLPRDSSRFRIECVDEDPDGDDRREQTTEGGGTGYHTYDTHNLKTFGRNTLETLPHADHYRNLLSATGHIRKRPTLLELHDIDAAADDAEAGGLEEETSKLYAKAAAIEETQPSTSSAPKFGWIQGVLVRCVLNIFGVMLFLRISWVIAQAGIGLATLIILLASVVTTLTALSMSAICTNGQVRGGGAYYMISRSLGPEFGGAIGIVFSLANAVAAAMYVVGFAETIRDILKEYGRLMVDEVNDVRIIGIITAVAMMAIALAGLSWESKAQLVLLAILLLAIVNFLIGSFIPPSEETQEKGVTGFSLDTFRTNFVPSFRENHGFFSVFAIYFPAATGILAGANISGDLRDAQAAIPKGTLLAIFLTTIVYLITAWIAGTCVVRDAAGPLIHTVVDGNDTLSMLLGNQSISDGAILNFTAYSSLDMTTTVHESSLFFAANDTISDFDVNRTHASCTPGKDCKYGIMNDMQVMQLVSVFGPIVIAGIVSATLSSALASLVSAPKVFQAVCKDNIFPYIFFFAKGYGKADEPRRAYVLTFFIAVACVCIGDLNLIAPLISNFFLMSYALINYSCFDASLAKSPGWRPAFKYYSMWLSLAGALLCVFVMFVMNWPTALITIVLITSLFFFVHYRKPDINWGSSTQAHVYRNALQNTMKLIRVTEHVKNFRPQILVLTGFPRDRPSLVDFTASVTKNISLMVCGHVIVGQPLEKLEDLRRISNIAHEWLARRKAKSFYTAITADSLRSGVQSMLQCIGLGKLKPNVMLMGFKSNWMQSPPDEVADYLAIIHDCFDQRCGVGILRLKEGLDCSPLRPSATDEKLCTSANGNAPHIEITSGGDGVAVPGQVKICVDGPDDPTTADTAVPPKVTFFSGDDGLDSSRKDSNEDEDDDDDDDEDDSDKQTPINPEDEPPPQTISRFDHKQKKGFIDVWWLFDDGGLTLLIPYILTTKKRWSSCRLRIYMAGTKKSALDRDQRQLATLLSKFRIEYSSMTVIPDISKRPKLENQEEFDKMINDWVLNESEGETPEKFPWKITDSELQSQRDKTMRHIRLRELLTEYSSDASLIVITLPMPRKGLCSAGLYMAWLESLSRDMPPMLMLRGNQENVLTYYS